MADSGFSVGRGDADPLGGADLRQVRFLAKTHAKMKELGPVMGVGGVPWICHWRCICFFNFPE